MPHPFYDEFEDQQATDPYARRKPRRFPSNVLEFDPYARQQPEAAPARQSAGVLDMPPRREPPGGYGESEQPVVRPEAAVPDENESDLFARYREELLKPRGKLSTIGGILSSIFLGRDIPGQMRGQKLGALQEAYEQELAEQQRGYQQQEASRMRQMRENQESRAASAEQRAVQGFETPQRRSEREIAEEESKAKIRQKYAPAPKPDTSVSEMEYAIQQAKAEGLVEGTPQFARRVSQLRQSLSRAPQGTKPPSEGELTAGQKRRLDVIDRKYSKRLAPYQTPQMQMRMRSDQKLKAEYDTLLDDHDAEVAAILGGGGPAPVDRSEGAGQSTGAPARPRAVNPQTGEEVEWDGRQWVRVQ